MTDDMIRCEGSLCPPATGHGLVVCSMCGQPVHRTEGVFGEVVVEHERKDLLAMVERGDFG